MNRLTWEFLSNPAREIFNIWMWGQDYEWARQAWNKLETQNLTTYETEIEKYVILIRFLTLGTVYHEFCEIAFDESADIEYLDWLGAFEDEGVYIGSLRLAQLLGRNFLPDQIIEDSDQEQTLIPDMVNELVSQQRSAIYVGLRSAFGGDSLLFASLWLSAKSFTDEDEDQDEVLDDVLDDVLNYDISANKMAAFSWVCDSGMLANYSSVSMMNKNTYIHDLVKRGESEILEFKIGACVDIDTRKNKSELEWKKNSGMGSKIVNEVAALLNSKGGSLLIGITDDGQIEGIDIEYAIANPRKRNWDGYELFLNDMIHSKIDKKMAHMYYKLVRHHVEKRDVCEIKVEQFDDLVFVDDVLYVKRGTQTEGLRGQQVRDYEQTRHKLIAQKV